MAEVHAEFVKKYGGVYEHSPWVAECAAAVIDNNAVNTDALARILADCVDNAARAQQLALIRAHPDLAGRAAVRGALTAESSEEQASAGLDQCSAAEYQRFQELNDSYKSKFGFPFVMAVRNSTRQQILDAFAARVENDYETEFETALSEIHRIAAMRLAAMDENA